MMAVVLVIFMYVAPLMACLGVMPEAVDWKLGFFATVAQRVGGQWFAWWMLAAAAVRANPSPWILFLGRSACQLCCADRKRSDSRTPACEAACGNISTL
jgi:hypothetical protein